MPKPEYTLGVAAILGLVIAFLAGARLGSSPTPPINRSAMTVAAKAEVKPAPIDVSKCFHVLSLERADASHYTQLSENTCGVEVERVYVLVKFFNGKGERIGVDYFGAGHVAIGERTKTRLETPAYVRHYKSIGVRKITADPLAAF